MRRRCTVAYMLYQVPHVLCFAILQWRLGDKGRSSETAKLFFGCRMAFGLDKVPYLKVVLADKPLPLTPLEVIHNHRVQYHGTCTTYYCFAAQLHVQLDLHTPMSRWDGYFILSHSNLDVLQD